MGRLGPREVHVIVIRARYRAAAWAVPYASFSLPSYLRPAVVLPALLSFPQHCFSGNHALEC